MRPNLEVFAETLEQLAKNDPNLLIVTSDSRGSGKLKPFGERFPEKMVEVGIAEQNLVGVAAGLASMGKNVFAVSPACFLSTRSLEQIKNDICYSDNPVRLIGISAGVSYGALGSTHHSLHDIAALRAINNINIVLPADEFETKEAIKVASKSKKPLYIRFGKKKMPNLGQNISPNFEIGKARKIREGKDIQIIGTGETVWPCMEAAELLGKEGIEAEIISMHSIKPFDHSIFKGNKPIITVEEHMVNGGLGEAVATYLMENRLYVPFKRMGIPDEYTVTGSQVEIFDHYGLNDKGIFKEAIELIKSL